MKDNNITSFSFLSKLYLKLKQNKLNCLERKIQKLHSEIEDEKALIKQKTQYYEQLNSKNSSIKSKYNRIINLFFNQDKTFTIQNNAYNISVFENLFIVKKSFSYILETKKNEEIYIFNSNLNDFLDYLITLNYSILVLSVETRAIVLKISLNI